MGNEAVGATKNECLNWYSVDKPYMNQMLIKKTIETEVEIDKNKQLPYKSRAY